LLQRRERSRNAAVGLDQGIRRRASWGGRVESDAQDLLFVSYVGAYLRAVCGRFDNLIARDAYRVLFKVGRLPKSNFPLRYNVAPTDQIPIVRIDRS
jgi:hypothetical protein